jgi:hypothetical protein
LTTQHSVALGQDSKYNFDSLNEAREVVINTAPCRLGPQKWRVNNLPKIVQFLEDCLRKSNNNFIIFIYRKAIIVWRIIRVIISIS